MIFFSYLLKKKSSGFTLVEVCVVFAVIIILIALSYPQFKRMRIHAWTAKGIHNAQQLMGGALSYATEHRGLTPQTDWSSYPDPSGYSYWVEEIAPYVYGEKRTDKNNGYALVDGTFRCPGLSGYKNFGDRWIYWDWSRVDWINISNYVPDAHSSYVPLNTLIASGARTPYLISTDKNIGTSGLTEGFQNQFDVYVPPEVWIYQGGVIVGYLDGHVEIVPKPNAWNVFKKEKP